MPFLRSQRASYFTPFCLDFFSFFMYLKSVIWRNYVRQFGIILFGKMAHLRWGIWLQIFKLHKNSYNLERKSKKILHISQNCYNFAVAFEYIPYEAHSIHILL